MNHRESVKNNASEKRPFSDFLWSVVDHIALGVGSEVFEELAQTECLMFLVCVHQEFGACLVLILVVVASVSDPAIVVGGGLAVEGRRSPNSPRCCAKTVEPTLSG